MGWTEPTPGPFTLSPCFPTAVRATSQGGDLMSDLFNKLAMRRKGRKQDPGAASFLTVFRSVGPGWPGGQTSSSLRHLPSQVSPGKDLGLGPARGQGEPSPGCQTPSRPCLPHNSSRVKRTRMTGSPRAQLILPQVPDCTTPPCRTARQAPWGDRVMEDSPALLPGSSWSKEAAFGGQIAGGAGEVWGCPLPVLHPPSPACGVCSSSLDCSKTVHESIKK